MTDQDIQKNVKLLLTKYAKLRNPLFKKQRIWAYWTEFEGVNIGITERQFIELTDGESISRAFRRVQQENKGLRADIDTQQRSVELSEQHRLAYK
jgi:hypothetical protein